MSPESLAHPAPVSARRAPLLARLAAVVASLAALFVAACAPPPEESHPHEGMQEPRATLDAAAIERFVIAHMEEHRLPGVAVAVVDRQGVLFSGGYGWADIERRIPMSAETVMNVASISKTVTNAAVLQLRDRGLLDLDDDVDEHLSFSVRNPRHPDVPITVRQLLTHTSSIDDGDAYDESYACGDPAVPLGDWVRGYLEPGGAYHDPEQSFLDAAPGKAYSYSNVAYGLLGHLVEVLSGREFGDATRESIFEPLGMSETGWYLADIEPRRHAEPYAWIEAGDRLDNALFGARNGEVVEPARFVPFCRYSFYNLPDGLMRTSVEQLGRFLVAHMRGGELDGGRILAEETVAEILSPQLDPGRLGREDVEQGLTWVASASDRGERWGHSGADPGVRTRMSFEPESGIGVVVFANRAGRVREIVDRLFLEATGHPSEAPESREAGSEAAE